MRPALIVLIAAAWVVAIRRMTAMGMEPGLGALAPFLVTWTAMMAAMMLPSALPVALRLDGLAPLAFASSYVTVWGLAGLVVFAGYRGIRAADAALVGAAAIYELTPLKRRCLARCRAGGRSGIRYGLHCLGCSGGLMLVLVVVGAMSVTWMVIVGALVFAEKVPRFGASLVAPVALFLVGVGALALLI